MIEGGGKPGEGEEALWYLRRLDGGLFTLQTVDYILAWLSMEDDGVSPLPPNLLRFQAQPTLDSIAYQTNAQSQKHVTPIPCEDATGLS